MVGVDTIRKHICAEPNVDRAIGTCFGCSREAIDQGEVLVGLTSYIQYLNKEAPGILLPGNALSILATL
jgi:hypothetical protein